MPVVFEGSAAYRPATPGPVVTVGNFDGVHRGHRALLDRVVERARARSVPALVYTFDPAPRDVLRPSNDIPRIQRLEDRVESLGEVGIDHVVIEPFTLELAAWTAERFAVEMLGGRLGASALVLGWDFRFGKGRLGTVASLADWLDVPVEQVAPFKPDGDVVSSSRIRSAVRSGEVAHAAMLLGREHVVVGTVVAGDQRGRTLGFPTANLVPDTPLVPLDGVYAVRTRIDGAEFGGVANIGTRPTFGVGGRTVEIHLLDYAGNLYGRTLAVRFVDRLRAERRFAGREDLVAQISADIEHARELLTRR